ncbi:MAG: Gfo/Idh/MocA family oxidoreductase [Anaerolineaceae bacterium]|nr:Gfo/Idh/MocA family oxidoreductase [Anaerolineaceae bacterium]
MTDRIRWGILGTGKIANRFAASLNNISDKAELLAIGSRTAKTGDAFADKYNIPRRYVGYEGVVNDPDVDIVYIGTPGVFHKHDVSMCLNHGKHVLCEKALTINAQEAKEIIALAREKRLFLMEAMWTRFFPIHVKIRSLLKEKTIGDVTAMAINFAATPPFDLNNRFFKLDLGAGVLLDTGSYGISWAYSLLGKPQEVVGLAHFGESGADYQIACLMKFPAGQLVSILSSQMSYDHKNATIIGTKGKIEIHDPWYKPEVMTIYRENQEPERVEMPLDGYVGYEYEAMAVMDCIQNGKTECDVMPLDESIEIMKTLDSLRASWNHKYPFEE